MGWGKKKLNGTQIGRPQYQMTPREEAYWLQQLGRPPASAPPSVLNWSPDMVGLPMSPPWAPSSSGRSGQSDMSPRRRYPDNERNSRRAYEDEYEDRRHELLEGYDTNRSGSSGRSEPPFEYMRHRKQSSGQSRHIKPIREETEDHEPAEHQRKHARKPSNPNTVVEDDDGSQKWTTKASEALAKVKLQTLVKSVEESSESLFTALTMFTLDLSDSDPQYSVEKYLHLAGTALAYLDKLEFLRIVGPRDARVVLPAIYATSLKRSSPPLATLALSRVSNVEEGNAFAGAVGRTCISLKLNDCKLPVWRPLLRHCTHLEIVEALVPPDGCQWFNRKQWSQLTSLRLGYGSITALSDLLDSCTAVDDEDPFLTALETLVISHFSPIPLSVIVRIARTLGTPLVRKLEISRLSADAFEPRVLTNLAAYFEEVEDLRIHKADEGEEDLSIQEARKSRTKAVDWTQGRYGMDDFGLAFASFPSIKTVEINHARYSYLLDTSGSTRPKKKDDEDDGVDIRDKLPVAPDGRSLLDLLSIDARALAAKCGNLKRIGYSFPVDGKFVDCQISWPKGKGMMPTVKPHFSKPKDGH